MILVKTKMKSSGKKVTLAKNIISNFKTSFKYLVSMFDGNILINKITAQIVLGEVI